MTSLPEQLERDQAIAAMNRGHALMVRDDVAGLQGALAAYDEAIRRLRPLADRTDGAPVAWINSLAAALMNHGHLLHRVHGVEHADAAIGEFDEAVRRLRALPATAETWPRRNLAGTLVNRANLLLDLHVGTWALADARAAADLVREFANGTLLDADLLLKAHRVECDAIGQLLVGSGPDEDRLAGEADDSAEAALVLIRTWQDRTRSEVFRELALRFFAFGTRLYQRHRPHFLTDFIRDHLRADDPEFQRLARAAVDAALEERLPEGEFLTIGDPVSTRRCETWRDLAAMREELNPADALRA